MGHEGHESHEQHAFTSPYPSGVAGLVKKRVVSGCARTTLFSTTVDTHWVASGVSVLSTFGGSCTFLPFCPEGEPVVHDSKGTKVPTTRVSGELRRFSTIAGERYTVS